MENKKFRVPLETDVLSTAAFTWKSFGNADLNMAGESK
jgi:hypothetical protein